MSVNQKHDIIKNRIEIYHDFTINLFNYIIRYYVDYESINSEEDISNHYNWCFDKVCDEFLLEGINFKDNESLRDYFKTYFYHEFYQAQNDSTKNVSLQHYEKFWKNIFEIENQKNKGTIKVLIGLYKIFDESIDKDKNILELV